MSEKKRIRTNFRLPPDLLEWMKRHAHKNHISLTQVVINGVVKLKEKSRGQNSVNR